MFWVIIYNINILSYWTEYQIPFICVCRFSICHIYVLKVISNIDRDIRTKF